MPKSGWIILGVLVLLTVLAVIFRPEAKLSNQAAPTSTETTQADSQSSPDESNATVTLVASPLDRVSERVTKKTFGTKVSPGNSPVSPEKFSGYHTGWDFEVFDSEISQDVPVKAFCSGPLRSKQTVSGYGGVVVQDCEIEGVIMTALYGHLNTSTVVSVPGENITISQTIGLLGDDKSSQTDGERKHLHFSLHKGSSLNLSGYVETAAELSGWINPDEYL